MLGFDEVQIHARVMKSDIIRYHTLRKGVGVRFFVNYTLFATQNACLIGTYFEVLIDRPVMRDNMGLVCNLMPAGQGTIAAARFPFVEIECVTDSLACCSGVKSLAAHTHTHTSRECAGLMQHVHVRFVSCGTWGWRAGARRSLSSSTRCTLLRARYILVFVNVDRRRGLACSRRSRLGTAPRPPPTMRCCWSPSRSAVSRHTCCCVDWRASRDVPRGGVRGGRGEGGDIGWGVGPY